MSASLFSPRRCVSPASDDSFDEEDLPKDLSSSSSPQPCAVESRGGPGSPQLRHDRYAMDGWRSWCVLGAAVALLVVQFGLLTSVGVYFQPLKDALQASDRQCAVLGSVTWSVMSFTSLLSTYAYKAVGARLTVVAGGSVACAGYAAASKAPDALWLFVAFAMVGLGFGLLVVPVTTVQTEYFRRYRLFAISFTSVGASLGTMAFPHVLLWAVELWGWRGSLRLSSALCLLIVCCGLVMSSRRERRLCVPLEEVADRRLLASPAFGLICLSVVTWAGGVNIFYGMSSRLEELEGLNAEQAAIVVSLAGGSNLVARLCVSAANLLPRLPRPLLFVFAALTWSFGAVWLTRAGSFGEFCLVGLVFGAGHGAMSPLITPLLVQLFGAERLAVCNGLEGVAFGVGAVAFPALAGGLAEYSQSLKPAFLLASGLGLGTAAFGAPLAWLSQQKLPYAAEPLLDDRLTRA